MSDRCSELEAQRLTARRPFDLGLTRGHAIATRQGPVVELENEVAAALFVGHDGAGNVEAAVRVRVDGEPATVTSRTPGRPSSPSSCTPSRFLSSKTLPITSVQSKVGSGTTRTVAVASPENACLDSGVRVRADDGRPIHELAFGHARTDAEEEYDRTAGQSIDDREDPLEHSAIARRFGRDTIHAC